jgi:hypothetical protein
MGGYVTHMEERRGAHRVMVGQHEGKRPLEKPRRRSEGNIKNGIFRNGMGAGLD